MEIREYDIVYSKIYQKKIVFLYRMTSHFCKNFSRSNPSEPGLTKNKIFKIY